MRLSAAREAMRERVRVVAEPRWGRTRQLGRERRG
jgi:hypothetical protein